MESLHNGQCGLCGHFGENHEKTPALVSIISSKQANEACWMSAVIHGMLRFT